MTAFSYVKTNCHPERKYSLLWVKFWNYLEQCIFWFTWAAVELYPWWDLIFINVSKNSKLFIIETFSLTTDILLVSFCSHERKIGVYNTKSEKRIAGT